MIIFIEKTCRFITFFNTFEEFYILGQQDRIKKGGIVAVTTATTVAVDSRN